MKGSRLLYVAWCGLALLLGGGRLGAEEPEVAISDADFKRLDTFEGNEISKADKTYAKKDYRGAIAAYDAFLQQFPKSPAVAYAVFRKARSLHLDNKRFEAIKQYNEVLDYFPNAVDYAGASLYFIGQCNAQNGDLPNAMKAWKEMADDVDYRKHFLAAGALSQLADNLAKQDKKGEANEYYKQAAIDFRKSNRDASWYALNKVLEYYVFTNPNEPKLREFYDKVQTFEWDPRHSSEDNYWLRTRENIRKMALGKDVPQEQKVRVCRYWAGVMEKKRAEDDDFQKDVADFILAYENDPKKWVGRLDKQFENYQKEGNYSRVIRFIAYYQAQKDKVQEYYGKLSFDKMNNGQVIALMRILLDHGAYQEMGRNVFSHIKLPDLAENERYNLERYMWHKDEQLVLRLCESFADKELGRMEQLRYYHWRRNTEKGLKLTEEMTKAPNFAKESFWLKAEMLHWLKKWPEAIASYQSADNPPTNIWRISECYMGMGKRDSAIGQLRELENFFKDQAPAAALRIAYIYRDTGDKEKYIAGLRGIMKKYPKSGESSTAHIELEKLGIKIGGGTDAD